MTDALASARVAVEAIVNRDGLQRLAADDVERLIALCAELPMELAQLRSPEVDEAEPAIIFPAE